MTTLRLRLPDVADLADWIERLDQQTFEYALIERTPSAQYRPSGGSATLAQLPRADTLEVVLPARAVRWVRVKLPRAKGPVLQRVLPNLVEDALSGDAHDCHYAVLPGHYADGQRDIAVTDRLWLRAARRLVQWRQPKRSVCISEAMLVPSVPFIAMTSALQGAPDTTQIGDPGAGFVRHAQGVLTFNTGAGDLPVEIRLVRQWLAEANVPIPLAGASPALRGAWAAELGLPLTPSDWTWRTAPPVDPAWSLFQFEFARSAGEVSAWWQTWRWPVRWAGACLVVAIAGLNLHAWKLQREADAIKARMRADFNTLLPGVSDRGEPLLVAKRQLSLAHGDDTFSVLSQALALAAGDISPSAPPPVKALEFRNGVLKAVLQTPAQAPALAERLRSHRDVDARADGTTLWLSRRRT